MVPLTSCHPTISYRPIRPSDLEILEQIHGELFPIRYESEFFQNVVHGRGIVSWAAIDHSRDDGKSDELIGFVTARVVPAKDSEIVDLLNYNSAESEWSLVYILTLGVVNSYRNLGIASSLILEVIKYASSIPTCQAVYLHVISYNIPAIHLYKKMSFKCIRKLPGFYLIDGQHYDSYLFVYFVKGCRSPCSPLELVMVVMRYIRIGFQSIIAKLWSDERKRRRPTCFPYVYHRGPLLTGNVKLGLVWYGPFGRVQKNVIRSFIKSLNYRGQRGAYMEPQVSAWWRVIECYQPRRRGVVAPIKVKVVRQIADKNYSVGKVLIMDFIPGLVQKATGGDKNTIAVIFAARGVTVQGLCMGKCSQHGILGRQPYILVGDPETECPGTCAWPFYPSDYGPKGVTLQPPSGNVGADAMVVSFASALAGIVTNPYNSGFYGGSLTEQIEAGTACPNMFGSGAFPGYTGKVRVDPANGGAFNARGIHGKKFLLPAVWNPRTCSCWTPL